MANKTLKQFVIIATLLFSVVMALSVYILQNCSSFGNCGFISAQVVNLIFFSLGAIGTTYCLIIVKGLDDKVDNSLIKEYKEMLENKNNNGA